MVKTAAGASPMEVPDKADANPWTATSAEFVRQFALWQDRANSEPVFVTHHGRARHVLLSTAAFENLERVSDNPLESDGSTAKLETLLSCTDQMFISVDERLTITALNHAAVAFLGIPAAAALGSQVSGSMTELSQSVLSAHLRRAICSGDAATLDVPAISRPGEWLRCTIFPYDAGAGCLIRVVTSEKVATTTASEAEAVREAIAATGLIGLGTLSLRGTFTHVDDRLASMAGFDAEALIHVRLTNIMPLSRRIEAAGYIEKVLSGGEAQSFSSALLVKQGGELPIQVGIAPLLGAHGLEGATIVVTARQS